ncbi:hypothetical protein [Xylanibacter ruminicola]|uniref:hypothetical protein n=1 Tax=Xylanibacter ruminicola TaxID=839 RepID=UPI00048E7596|nr:hypothetical protein [Xylanibacter ruminicola]
MKKKIINGILMVALVGATSTSFVSCKDTSEDVKTDLMAQVNAVKANLEPRVEQAEKDIDALEGRMTTAEGDIKTLKSDVTSLKNRVSTLEQEKDSLAQVTKTIEGQLTQVESKINKIVEALTNMVTSVTVNATSNGILANSKVFPGLNLQFLGAAYGQATYAGEFPSTEADDYVAGHGVVLTANDIAGAKKTEWGANDYLPVEKANAGTMYFTLNPSNISDLEAQQIALSLVNSQNAASFVEIGKAEKDTTTVLEWGLTRAEFQPTLWKAEATIDLDDAETLKKVIDPTQMIDFKTIADKVRTLISDAYHSARTTSAAKATAKEVLKDGAQIVATLLKTEIPSMPALALKAEWNDTVGTRSVLSDYSLAATAYKPLGFGFGAELGVDGRTISLDKIDAAVAKLVNKVQDRLNRLDVKLQDVKVSVELTDGGNPYLTFKTNASGKIIANTIKVVSPATAPAPSTTTIIVPANITIAGTLTADREYFIALDAADALYTSVPVTALNEMVSEALQVINDVNYYADRAKNLEARATNFLEKYINKVILKIANDGLTRVLEPVLLYQGSEGVNRLAPGVSVKAGAEIDLIPTTMTYELFAPAYKKYVAVIGKDGKAKNPVVLTRGQKDFSKVTVKIEEGDQAIVYSALDFSGKQIAKKVAINVVK